MSAGEYSRVIQYTIRRLLATIPVLLLTSVIVFGLMRLIPGDPVELLVENAFTEVSEELIEKLRAQHGLDRPLYTQYLIWLGNFLKGDLGWSYLNNQAVWDIIRPRILPTVQIGLLGLVFAMLVAVPVGMFAAMHPRTWKDWLSTAGALIGAAMPYFLTGGLLIYLVSLRLRWLPASGYVPLFDDPVASLRSSILPALTLSFVLAAVIMRQTRSSFVEVLQHAYIRTARAKGLAMRTVIVAHAFKNAILPVVTVLGIELGSVFSGAVITETIFAVPGIGRLLVDSILARDYSTIQAVVLFITLAVVVANLLVDLAYGWLDPRIRRS
ncbi:MAG: ABC transporter permease [Thiotrichales bacterium]|nr:ABC transporter permease [Thiotrichales bacterium]